MRKQREEKLFPFFPAVSMNPMEAVPKQRIFCRERGKQICEQQVSNTSHQSACVRFHPGNGFLCLHTGQHRSLSVFVGYFHLSDAPITWMNDCLLIWACLPPVREINTLEGRKKRTVARDGNRSRWLMASRLNGLAEPKEKKGPHQSGDPPVLWSPLELGGEGGPAKFPAAAPRRPSPDAPGGDPSVWAARGLEEARAGGRLMVTPQSSSSSSAFHRGRCTTYTWYGVFNEGFLERVCVAGMLILKPSQHVLQRPPGYPLRQVHHPGRHESDTLALKK